MLDWFVNADNPQVVSCKLLAVTGRSAYGLRLIAQFTGFRKREMNNPLALCELAARAPNTSAGHMVK
jgi:hypothetical protein